MTEAWSKITERFGGVLPALNQYKNPGGVIGVSPGCQGWTRTFGRHQHSIGYTPAPFNPSLRLLKNYRRHPEYKPVMYLGLHHRAGPPLNVRASALSYNIPPRAFKKGGERQGSREAKSANYAQETGLNGKYRHSLGRGVRYGGRSWE